MKFKKIMIVSTILLCHNVFATSVSDLERQVRASDQARINMQQQLDQMSEDLNILTGKLEEANNTINDLLKNQQDLYQQIAELSKNKKVDQNSSNANNTNKQNSNLDQTSTLGDGKKDYESAVSLVMKDKKYNEAINSFKNYIKNYPNSPYISNAYFWLGESYFKTNQLTDAKNSFLVVVKDNVATKRAEALYKLGLISKADKNNDVAKKFFMLVVRDYPGTTTAKLADNEIKKL